MTDPRTVLLTGASSGIGAATARHLVGRGFTVYGTSRRPEKDESEGVRWLALDVGDEASVQDAVEQLLARESHLDALVCNAGFGIFGSIEEVSIEDARRQLDTNFFGVLRCLRAVLPHMRERRQGRIVLLGSLAGRAPIPFQAHYSASKAAVDSLALALANEVRAFGLHVSLIEPGDIDTPFNEAMAWRGGQDSDYGAAIERCERVVRESLPKAPGPEVVARAIGRALSDARPRMRYPVGPDSWLVPFGRRFLPDRWFLRTVRAHFDL